MFLKTLKKYIIKDKSIDIPTNSIIFSIIDDVPNVKIMIEDLSENHDSAFARLLYELTSGSYNTNIIETLSQIQQTYPYNRKLKIFIENIVFIWRSLLADSHGDFYNRPVIKPTEFSTK